MVLTHIFAGLSDNDKEICANLDDLNQAYHNSTVVDIKEVTLINEVTLANIKTFFEYVADTVIIGNDNTLFRETGNSVIMDPVEEKLLNNDSEIIKVEMQELTKNFRENEFCGLIKRILSNTLPRDLNPEDFPKLATFLVNVQAKSLMLTPETFVIGFPSAKPFFPIGTQ